MYFGFLVAVLVRRDAYEHTNFKFAAANDVRLLCKLYVASPRGNHRSWRGQLEKFCTEAEVVGYSPAELSHFYNRLDEESGFDATRILDASDPM